VSVRYSYLKDQFANADDLWDELKRFVATGDFTLGKPLTEFEANFASLIGVKHALGVNSGTDAIKISLKAAGIQPGDEVITAANTFVATVGAINELGAVPVFVDVDDSFCINVDLIEEKITPKTKAIVPVHFTGYMVKMDKVMEVATKYNLQVIEDACQGILAEWQGRKSGTWGLAGAFSLHPLKNLNVWSDGGMIVTNDDQVAGEIKLLRNHGLIDRDHVEILGYNSRLDTFQAVVGNWLIPQAKEISDKRILNARKLDEGLGKLSQIRIPERPKDMRVVYHLYIVYAQHRDELLAYCKQNGIEAKVHYPVPIYRQKALSIFSRNQHYPVTDFQADNIISFPCDQHLTDAQISEIIQVVSDFYQKKQL
jgi:dTDP-4-amino-4,6-dideoxygalactose transaminase